MAYPSHDPDLHYVWIGPPTGDGKHDLRRLSILAINSITDREKHRDLPLPFFLIYCFYSTFNDLALCYFETTISP